jgi:hypothetical protein
MSFDTRHNSRALVEGRDRAGTRCREAGYGRM